MEGKPTKKPILVGEAPSQFSDPKKPFSGASGKTLTKYAGLSGYVELTYNAHLVNVLQRWPGKGFKGEKGSRFPLATARRAAKRLSKKFEFGDVVVLCGKRVAKAFGIEFSDYFSWKLLPRGKGGELVWFVCAPHPSGCNHYLNPPANRRRFSKFLKHVMQFPGGLP